jgi:hypothetical protein
VCHDHYLRATKKRPIRVLYFRGGVSDGQFGDILSKEVITMQEVSEPLFVFMCIVFPRLSSVWPMLPRVCLVVATRRNSTESGKNWITVLDVTRVSNARDKDVFSAHRPSLWLFVSHSIRFALFQTEMVG